jgi:hypothetical protein
LKREYNPSYSNSLPSEKMDVLVDDDQSPNYMTPLEEIRALRKEIKSLRAQQKISAVLSLVDDLSSSEGGIGAGAVGAAPPSSASSGIDSNKLNIRLKEMFRERISSYREAVYLLLGYKVLSLSLSLCLSLSLSNFPQ